MNYIGKFIKWKNGLRFKVIGHDPNYPQDYLAESIIPDADGKFKQWSVARINIEEDVAGKEIISEEEAKKTYAEIKHNVPQYGFCSCCDWRVGKPNVSIKLDLKDGQIPADEEYRIDKELSKFFVGKNIVPRILRSDNGIEIQFIDMSSCAADSS